MSRRALLVALLLLPNLGIAQAPSISFGGFVDTYLAWDAGRPRNIDRAYTTQAARHAEFNVNLAYLDAILTGDRVRGRLALQAGTSVEANYLGEPTTGRISGGDLSRHIQEAVVGVRMSQKAWIDAGIFLSHTGNESWISRDNPTYTRSLVADFSPYYESGAKLTWQVRPDFTALFTVVNGWQIVSENNADKSVGARLDWSVSPHVTVSYYNLIGNEQPDSVAARMRLFNGFAFKWSTDEYTVMARIDGGRQDTDGPKASSWWGGSLIGRVQVTEHVAFSARGEMYEDPNQVLVVTNGPGFRAIGGSFGLDFEPEQGVAWRTEVRGLRGRDAYFPDRGSSTGFSTVNTVIVTSLSVTF